MTPIPVSSNPPQAALAAFLRGVERRGALLAELQVGDHVRGDAALSGAMCQFRVDAAGLTMSDWPRGFWSALLAQPQLRDRTPVALVMEATDRLAEIGSGPRAALLLRLAAGLSETDAAAVLGVSQASYRMALQSALPRHADGRADPETWQRLREQIHRRIKTLPADRLQRLAVARERALTDAPLSENPSTSTRDGVIRKALPAAPVTTGTRPANRRPRWLLPLLWILLALCAIGLLASFWWPGFSRFEDAAIGEVRIQPLAETGAPASRYGDVAWLVSHGDFELLTDPQGEAAARDLAFHSWLVAQGELPAAAVDASEDAEVAGDDEAGESPTENDDAAS